MLWLDIEKRTEMDIDEKFQLGDIKSMLALGDKFYVLANKF